MQIKIMRKQGMILRAIACELRCSVNTVRKYLEDGAPPAYQERVQLESKVAPKPVTTPVSSQQSK